MQAVEKLWGVSMRVPVMTVPFWQHVLQVDQVAVMHVLCKIIAVMEMDDTFVVCLNDILGQQHTLSEILGNLSGHVVTLGGVHHGVLVGVLCLASSLLHSIRLKILSSVVLD